MPNTAATNEKSLKLIYFFNCCIKYLIKKVAFYRVCIFSIKNIVRCHKCGKNIMEFQSPEACVPL